MEGIDYFETFSPVASYPAIRTFLSIAAARDWQIQQYDAVTAVLKAPLDEEIYVKPPEGYERDGQVWRLRKALYGLKQAGRQWWKMLQSSLHDFGLVNNTSDSCLLICKDGQTALVTIVDDLAVAGTPDRVEAILAHVESLFSIKRLGDLDGNTFVGLEVKRDRSQRMLSLCQSRYAREVLTGLGFNTTQPLSLPVPIGTRFSAADELSVLADVATYTW